MIKILHQPFLRGALLLFVLSVHLASCISAKGIPGSSQTQKIENIPFYPQETYACGPSSLAGVLNYWGVHVTPEEIARDIYNEKARGTLTLDMMLYAKQKGLNAEQYRGSMDDIKRNITSGYPVIVLVDYGGALFQMKHFMVIVGYNEHGILANSGAEKGKFIPQEDFLKIWGKANYWTLLITKK